MDGDAQHADDHGARRHRHRPGLSTRSPAAPTRCSARSGAADDATSRSCVRMRRPASASPSPSACWPRRSPTRPSGRKSGRSSASEVSRTFLVGRRPVLSDPHRARHAGPGRYRLRPHRRPMSAAISPRSDPTSFRISACRSSVVVVYVLVILAACYSTIDGASAALSSVVAVDIIKRYLPNTSERTLFIVTKISVLVGGAVALLIVLSRRRFHHPGADHLCLEDIDPAAAGASPSCGRAPTRSASSAASCSRS